MVLTNLAMYKIFYFRVFQFLANLEFQKFQYFPIYQLFKLPTFQMFIFPYFSNFPCLCNAWNQMKNTGIVDSTTGWNYHVHTLTCMSSHASPCHLQQIINSNEFILSNSLYRCHSTINIDDSLWLILFQNIWIASKLQCNDWTVIIYKQAL